MKLSTAMLGVLAVGVAVSLLPAPWSGNARWIATYKLALVSGVTLLAVWPALVLTRSISRAEVVAIRDVFRTRLSVPV